MAVLYLAVPNPRPDFTRFNCDDSESYLTLAWNLAHGRGYTQSTAPGVYVPHTTWPPGTPLLMMPAVLLSGNTLNWYAVKWTMCVVGLLGVTLTWLFLRDLTGKLWIADVGALLLGLNPVYWDFSHQAMAEVPLTVSCIAALYLVHRVWSRDRLRWSHAFWVGMVSGISMLFKGHGAALIVVPLAYYVRPSRRGWLLRTGVIAYLCFLVGFAAPQASWMVRKQMVQATGFDGINHFRSYWAVNPNDATSRLVTVPELAERVLTNIRLYAIYRPAEQMVPGLWAGAAFEWKGSGWLALLLSSALIGLAFRPRSDTLPVCLAAAPILLLNLGYGFGGAARFWVPVTSLLTMAIVIGSTGSMTARLGVLNACAAILFLNLGVYIVHHERFPYYDGPGHWQQRAELFQAIAERKDLRPVNVLTQNARAFHLITGFPASAGDRSTLYDHVILDSRETALPADAHILASKPPLVFASLPRALSWSEIQRLTHPDTVDAATK